MLLFIISLNELGKLRRTFLVRHDLAHITLQFIFMRICLRAEERIRLWAHHFDILVCVLVYLTLLLIHDNYFFEVVVLPTQLV